MNHPFQRTSGVKTSLIALFVFLFAAFMISAYLHFGISLSPDCDYYISGARHLLAQGAYSIFSDLGLKVSVLNFPPVTSSLLLAFHQLSPASFFTAAKVMDIFCFATFSMLVFLAVQFASKNLIFSLFAAVLCIFSSDLMMVSVRLWSEPPYIVFSTLGMMLLAQALVRPLQTRIFLLAASLFLSVCVVTRYVGVSLVISTVLVVFVYERFYKKAGFLSFIQSALCIALLPFLTFSTWILRNQIASGSASGRSLDLGASKNPINFERFIRFIDQAAVWFCPTAVPRPLRVTFIVALSLGMVALIRLAMRHRHEDPKTMRALLMSGPFLVYPWVHYLFINMTHLLVGEGYPGEYYPDEYRYFSPLHVSFLIGSFSLLGGTWHHIKVKSAKTLVLITLIWMLFVNVARGSKVAYQAYKNGHSGGTVLEVISQPGFRYFLNLEKTAPIWVYGTFPDLTYFLAYREVKLLPLRASPEVESAFCNSPGFLFIPKRNLKKWAHDKASRPHVSQTPLTLLLDAEDFTIFRTDPCKTTR